MRPSPTLFGRRFLLGFILTALALRLDAAEAGIDTPKLQTEVQKLLPQAEYYPTRDEFNAIGQAVLDLLRSKDTTPFVAKWSPSTDDWHSLITDDTPADQKERLLTFAKRATNGDDTRLKSSAKSFIDRADSLHIDFAKGNWRFQVVPPKHVGNIYFSQDPDKGGKGEPYIDSLEIILLPEGQSDSSTNGNFSVLIQGAEKFPAGWRVGNGLLWKSFPNDLVDEKTVHELAILDKVAHYDPITSEDDPMLTKLADTLVHFVRTGDVGFYDSNALINIDLIWNSLQKTGRSGPSRRELESEGNKMLLQEDELARDLLKQMADAGINFSNAEIQVKSATIKQGQTPTSGSVDGMMGRQFKATFSVRSDGKSKTGASLSGDYTLAADQILRFDDGWRIAMRLRWDQFPPGVIDDAAQKTLDFENYVAENRTLPPNTPAPEIEFTTLVGNKAGKLSDLKGKVVLLDFWATWCGPCQQPMAELQKLRKAHPNWGDKVAIVPVSIDDTMNIVLKHVNQRGWTNTMNVWAGDGGWQSKTAKTFRVTQVPTTYLLDASGKIIYGGFPDDRRLADTINELLK